MSSSLRAFVLSVGSTLAAVLCLAGNASAQASFQTEAGFANSARASSWVAGGHAGYNWQSGAAVFGFETDLQGTHLDSAINSAALYTNFPFGNLSTAGSATSSALIDWYGTFRGRLGGAYGPWLLYITAGLAYGDIKLDSRYSTQDNVGRLGPLTALQASSMNTGWVVGAGIDYRLGPNLIFNVLYQHVDLGSLNAASTNGPAVIQPFAFWTNSQQVSAHAQFDAVVVGLTWQFTPTGPFGSWAGGYLGGQAGGAWGNNTDAVDISRGTGNF